MTQTQRRAVIDSDIFFDVLFCGLILKNFETISPDRKSASTTFSFDEACLESFKWFKETCSEQSIEISVSLVPSSVYGTCDLARSYLLWMAQNGHGHFRMPYNGVFYFDIPIDNARKTISEIALEYMIPEDVLLELANKFLDVYTK